MLRDGEVPEGRAEAAVVQKVAHRVGHGALEPLQGAAYLVDSVHRHRERTIRVANQNGGEYRLIHRRSFSRGIVFTNSTRQEACVEQRVTSCRFFLFFPVAARRR